MERVMLVIRKKCFKKSVLNGELSCKCWNYGRCISPNAFCELKTEYHGSYLAIEHEKEE